MAKIVMIGGGSYTWAANLIRDMVIKPELAGSELWLVDINAKALKDLTQFCKSFFKYTKSDWSLHSTTNRDEALPKADFVVITISTGGHFTMGNDLEIPYKYGIYQPVGDTVGPGGISRALRSIPVFLDFAASIKEHCPNAWVLQITNPMTVLTQILCQQGCKTVGLCHELYGVWGELAEQAGCGWDDVHLEVAGINHFAFVLSAACGGIDGFKIFEKMARDPKRQLTKANLKDPEVRKRQLFRFEHFRRTGQMMYVHDRHTSEFFGNVLTKESGYGKAYGIKLTTIQQRRKGQIMAIKRNADLIKNPDHLDLKGSREAMSSLMVSLMSGKHMVDVVNLPNEGQIENLPRGVVVETMATITRDKIIPHAVGKIPDGMATLLNHHATRFNTVIEAGIKGDRKLALQAMASDPLVNNWGIAGKLLDELLKANKKFLPQF